MLVKHIHKNSSDSLGSVLYLSSPRSLKNINSLVLGTVLCAGDASVSLDRALLYTLGKRSGAFIKLWHFIVLPGIGGTRFVLEDQDFSSGSQTKTTYFGPIIRPLLTTVRNSLRWMKNHPSHYGLLSLCTLAGRTQKAIMVAPTYGTTVNQVLCLFLLYCNSRVVVFVAI